MDAQDTPVGGSRTSSTDPDSPWATVAPPGDPASIWATAAPTAQPDAGSPWALPAQPPGCQFCGSVPATDMTLHQGIGMLLVRRTKTFRARVCRDCGIALFRRMQSRTLLTGWWGLISLFINLGTIWSNYQVSRNLQTLDEPRPPGVRTVATPRTTPLPLGRPTYLRPQALGVVGAVIAVTLVLGLWRSRPTSTSVVPTVGVCASVDGGHPTPVDCSDPTASERIVAILPSTSGDAGCPATANATSHSDTYGLICWEPV